MLLFYLSLIEEPNSQRLFEEIYIKYKHQMFYVAKGITGNDHDAEDIVHDVFLKIALKHISIVKKLSNPDDIRNYLLKATKNTAINCKEKKSKENISIDLISEKEYSNYPALNDDEFVDLICLRSSYNEVVNAIKQMPSPYREVLYYHFVLELTISETSKLLGIQMSTVKMQLVRGKKHLLMKLGVGGTKEDGHK